jgi:hypothetical protein
MNDKRLNQEGGESSENYQALNNITVNRTGLSYAEAKDLIMLIMEQSFIKLSEQALATAKARVEEMTTAYLDELTARDPALVEVVQQPSIQIALVVAQSEYVETGNKDLAGLSVADLVERTSQAQKTLSQTSSGENVSIDRANYEEITSFSKDIRAILAEVKERILGSDSLDEYVNALINLISVYKETGKTEIEHPVYKDIQLTIISSYLPSILKKNNISEAAKGTLAEAMHGLSLVRFLPHPGNSAQLIKVPIGVSS